MKKQSFALLAACIGVLAMGASAALSQEDMKIIKAEAFASHTRPASVFVHDAHNEKAKIEDCAQCHHGKDADGKQDKSDISAGVPCADCHAVDARQGTPLKRAYHQQCIKCHVEQKQGPTHCAGCHKR